MLVAISHIDLAPLASPEVAHGSWPHSGLDDYDAVLHVLVQWVGCFVLREVAILSQDPGWVVTLASLVLGDWLQSLFEWISRVYPFNYSFQIFIFLQVESLWIDIHMPQSIALEDVLSVMDPT